MAEAFGHKSAGRRMATFALPILLEMGNPMRRAKHDKLVPAEIIPLSEGWRFEIERDQVRI